MPIDGYTQIGTKTGANGQDYPILKCDDCQVEITGKGGAVRHRMHRHSPEAEAEKEAQQAPEDPPEPEAAGWSVTGATPTLEGPLSLSSDQGSTEDSSEDSEVEEGSGVDVEGQAEELAELDYDVMTEIVAGMADSRLQTYGAEPVTPTEMDALKGALRPLWLKYLPEDGAPAPEITAGLAILVIFGPRVKQAREGYRDEQADAGAADQDRDPVDAHVDDVATATDPAERVLARLGGGY